MIQPGDKVQILYPENVAGETGTVLEQEMLEDGTLTGYWLLQVDGDDAILALQPCEIQVHAKLSDSL